MFLNFDLEAWEAIYIFIFLSQNNDLEIGMKSISAKKYIIEDHILLINWIERKNAVSK